MVEQLQVDPNNFHNKEMLKCYLADSVALVIFACLRLMQKIRSGDFPPSQSEVIPNALKTLQLALDMCRLDTDVSITK